MTTNTNTTKETSVLSTDIYEISDFIDNIRRNAVPDVSETSSMVGIFGYLNEIFSQTLQNTLIAVSETSNETIPTRAKFAKNVIAHALHYGITKIMSTPAVMTLMLYLPVSYVELNFTELDPKTGKAKFIFDKDVPITIGGYEFHLDYDIIITRIKNQNGNYVYTAMYDLFYPGTTEVKQQNPISNITNPYITTLIQTTIEDTDYIAFSARLHQVTTSVVSKTILTNSTIENSTVTFEFEDQLASFDVDVIENGVTTHLTPIYSGLIDYSVKDGSYCNYEYIDENTIRIIFDRDSYVPGMNAVVNVNIKLSEGSNGNFTYNNNFRSSMKSEKYNNYNGMYILVYPLLDGMSSGGKDKKSISMIKKIIPREASSRGAIINTTDLENFFNSIDSETCRLYFSKKRDNPFERLYYAHIIMRKEGIVYPTNTLDLKLLQSDFVGYAENNNLCIKPGTVIYYYNNESSENYASLIPPEYIETDDDLPYNIALSSRGNPMRVFEYISPFLISVDDDLLTSYFLTIMNDNKVFEFDSINTESDLQFVATNMNWRRKFIYYDENNNKQIYDNKYKMSVSITQNNNMDYSLIKFHFDPDGNVIYDDIRVKMVMVLYSDETGKIPYRYIEGYLAGYDRNNYIYDFEFELTTNDVMDLNNRINIMGVHNAKPEQMQKRVVVENKNNHGYMNSETFCKIFIMADFGTKAGDMVGNVKVTEETAEIKLYGSDGIGNRTELETIIPVRDDIVNELLKNEIYLEKDGKNLNIVTIIKSNPEYLKVVKEYNGDEQETEAAILKYIRNNKNSDFVQNVLLKDEDINAVIDSYWYDDYSRYTVCNVMNTTVNFYYDYSDIMSSVVNVEQVQKTDSNGNKLFKEIHRTDSLGNDYIEYKPIWMTNNNNSLLYNYTINRIPLLKNGFINTEEKMEDFVYDLEERRKYINACMLVLEETFGIDLKFFNTFGPSRRFYYNNPSETTYKAKVAIESVNVYSNTSDEDNTDFIVGTLDFGDEVLITKIKGQWGYITKPYTGWIKVSTIVKIVNYIDNVSLNMKFALEAQSSADKYIANNIIADIKDYIEDINEVTELHVPNIITLITNSYRDQLIYFECLDLNGYGPSCQHVYLDTSEKDLDICPEFINIETSDDAYEEPQIKIAVY